MPNPICIHQVGKVGSTSVLETLRDLLPGVPIHQTHVLGERSLMASIDEWLGRSRQTPGCKPPLNLLASIAMSRVLEQGTSQGEWHVLSLVREPISRNASAFFQNLRHFWSQQLSEKSRQTVVAVFSRRPTTWPDEDDVRKAAAELVRLFKARYARQFVDEWFDEEMKGVFGVDVFAEPFDRDRGWQLYRSNGVRMLLLRLEDIDIAFEPGVREWLTGSPWQPAVDACRTLSLKRANEAGNKNYALLHREFMEQLILEPSLVEQEYACRTARTFYSTAELERFAAKWTGHRRAPDREGATVAS